MNSAYRVRGEGDDQEWTEIGRRSPQLPQMFYPTENDVTIKQGDYVAAVCTMYNSQSRVVRIGYNHFFCILLIYLNILVQLAMMKCAIFI